MTEKFEYETQTGEVLAFHTKTERDEYTLQHALDGLVSEGYGELVETNDGPTFRINDRGRAYLKGLETTSPPTSVQ